MGILCLAITGLLSMGAPNPVLPNTADVGVFQYAGQYYLMGVRTSGGMYLSDDLVHWSGPEHAFSMDNTWATGPAGTDENIHACDMLLRNGVFHLYWSVNHGELRQIGHAVADDPKGPYKEPVRDVPFDGRIDPQCFQDEDGLLYFYTVKFTGGNVIWGQPMASPWALTGEPKALLSASHRTWETLDFPPQQVNEGPFVVQYRDRYYMLYNANHTAPRFGHYALGVAESDTPLGFTNSGKYGFPVLRSNRDPKHADADAGDALPEVKNCGQPTLLRGPNGIEWWLVYFADQGKRSQCIDRAHFFGRELYVEGPTTADTPGYHPVPAMPSFRDLFEDDDALATRWDLAGSWHRAKGAMHVSGDSTDAVALARMAEARSSLLEATLRYGGHGEGRMGVLAWDDGRGSTLRIGIDRAKNLAFCLLRQGGEATEHLVPLAPDFNWAGPHTLLVENNEGAFKVYLDAVLQVFPEAKIRGYVPGVSGLFAAGCSASFESFSLTRGWDEWGSEIHGWRNDIGQIRESGAAGIALGEGESVFKGDLLTQYEFATQFRSEGDGGIYLIYADWKNYLQLTADRDFTRIKVSGKRRGEPVPERSFPVRRRIHRAHEGSGNGNNLRVVKLKDRVLFFAEGLELGEIEGSWPDSRVGLFSEKGDCAFNGLTVYELP